MIERINNKAERHNKYTCQISLFTLVLNEARHVTYVFRLISLHTENKLIYFDDIRMCMCMCVSPD